MSAWRTHRLRLTIAFFALATITLGLAATATTRLVEQETLGTLDTVLLEEATTLAGLVGLPAEQLAATVRNVAGERDMGGGKFILVRDGDGRVVVATRGVPRAVMRQQLGRHGPGVMTVGEDEGLFRVAGAPMHAGGTVAVGIPAARVVRTVQRTRWSVGIAAGVLLAILTVGVWTIAGRATRAIDRLAEEVATVEAGSLARRLTTRGTVEVDRLVFVLNRVLQRLEASIEQMRRFTADAAHELRTPLTALRVRLEIALATTGPSVSRDPVADALEQAGRLERLAEDLLLLARVESGSVAAAALEERLDVGGLVAEVGEALAPLAEEQGRPLAWTTPHGPVVVCGSAVLLRRVLLNLLDNAMRHTPASAGVIVDAQRRDGLAVVEVRDAGPGIPPARLPHVFERFQGSAGGTGLGLALAREIVGRHGGTLTIEAGEQGGTVARVALPIARDDPATAC